MDIPNGLISALRTAERVAVLTGAGVSQESGLRTFRDLQNGLWSEYRPEDLASAEAFRRNPGLVWEWYTMRREKARSAEPNAGHFALAEMERRFPTFTLITQNVDGLHQKAGAHRVIELHGNIHQVICFDCGLLARDWDAGGGEVPLCTACGGMLRPNVVWFGETLPPQALAAAVEAARNCQVFFSVGTSGLVQPAASLAYGARNNGAVLVEINAEPTPLTPKCDYALHGKSGEILPALVKTLWG